MCAIAVATVTALLEHDVSEAFDRRGVLRYERDFGFQVGAVKGWPSDSDPGMPGITHVTPGGPMDRAGFRSGDLIVDPKGYAFAALHWVVSEAAAGRTRCLDVINVADARAQRFTTRQVCLPGRD